MENVENENECNIMEDKQVLPLDYESQELLPGRFLSFARACFTSSSTKPSPSCPRCPSCISRMLEGLHGCKGRLTGGPTPSESRLPLLHPTKNKCQIYRSSIRKTAFGLEKKTAKYSKQTCNIPLAFQRKHGVANMCYANAFKTFQHEHWTAGAVQSKLASGSST